MLDIITITSTKNRAVDDTTKVGVHKFLFLADTENLMLPILEANHISCLPEQEAAVAMMGLPKAGDITRAQLRIKESKEFKVRS